MKNKIDRFIVSNEVSLREAMKKFDQAKEGVIFIVDPEKKLQGSLSSGDIRRWLLKGGDLSTKIIKICNKNPFAISTEYDLKVVKEVMLQKRLMCVPIIDSENKIVDLILWSEVFGNRKKLRRKKISNVAVVIMAGGKGSRLEPITKILPKPLIPIGNKSVIELIIDRFLEYKIRKFYLSVNYKAEIIKAYFRDIKPNYEIVYINEVKPLGTVGCLRYLNNKLNKTFFLVNCDTLISSNYDDIIKFHKRGKFDITIVAAVRNVVIPYGICEIDRKGVLLKINEKPENNYLVNTGMYLISPKILNLIPKGKKYDMNQLIGDSMKKGYMVGVFPTSENSWLDIGEWHEYKKTISLLNL